MPKPNEKATVHVTGRCMSGRPDIVSFLSEPSRTESILAQEQHRVGLDVRGAISRGDFGLRWQQALETGGVLVGDEVRITADIAAVCTAPDATGEAA